MPVISGDGVLPGSQAGVSPETVRHLDSVARDYATAETGIAGSL